MPNREFTPSSGNVFADLNLPHADDRLKGRIGAKSIAEIQRRRLTAEPSSRDSWDRSAQGLSAQTGQTVWLLNRALHATLVVLGRDIEITVKGRTKSRSVARLRVA